MLKLVPYLESKEHIIWDWNGTLLNDIELCVHTIGAIMEEQGLERVSQDIYKQKFGFPIRNYYERLGFDFQKTSFEVLGKQYVESYMSQVYGCHLHPGAIDLLSHLKKQGKTQSILSASDQESLDSIVAHHQIAHLFDFVYGISDIYAASKLDRGLELMRDAKTDPADCVLIGDTDHDLEVGNHLGIDVILVSHGHQCELKLRSLHKTVL